MARIKIKDLPRNMKVNRKKMRRIMGGGTLTSQLDVRGISSSSILTNYQPESLFDDGQHGDGSAFNSKVITPGKISDDGYHGDGLI